MIAEKSYRFAVRIVKLCQYLRDVKHEYILSQQLEKSGTSIRANVTEGQQGQSRAVLSLSSPSLLKRPLRQSIGFPFCTTPVI